MKEGEDSYPGCNFVVLMLQERQPRAVGALRTLAFLSIDKPFCTRPVFARNEIARENLYFSEVTCHFSERYIFEEYLI